MTFVLLLLDLLKTSESLARTFLKREKIKPKRYITKEIMEQLQQYLENKFMINIIKIVENENGITKNQKYEIIKIFKQKYTTELIGIFDCEASLTEIYNNFNIWREPGNVILTPRFVKEFHREWEKYLRIKNELINKVTESNN